MLSTTDLSQFKQHGYLILADYLSKEEIAAARERINTIIDEFDPTNVSVFSTTDHSLTSTAYFIESASRISCFFEEAAFNYQGKLTQPKELSINKVGHALHDLDPVFRNISYKVEMAVICGQLGMTKPRIVQSQYIFKQPGIGGEVAPHQDSTFIYTSPPSCVGFWMALEDAKLENGCLMAIPGSQKSDLGSLRFVRNAEGTETFFTGEPGPDCNLDEMVPLEVESGSLILLHGSLVHMSTPNHSSHSRHAYILHIVDGEAKWSANNWLQRPASFPFKPLVDQSI
jgi:phytanoyl-CoA hydroxylase